ncbi:non-SMC condensin I complex subunit H [Arctopsyche grandis]|uniref:non-SMC condensin I complex subunit H n=1 Tax=Arctopsyche grandis TaxID=121162 RepID=UPI00406D86C1
MPESPRRRSFFNRAAAQRPQQQDENDDEAERAELVAADLSKVSQFSTPNSLASRRSAISIDLTKAPQIEHFQGCLKLYAENKINKDNAWNLQLIDFMSAMLRKHDARMENLQMASTTLDASTRIYSYRVDAIHYDVLKMAGGLSKAVQNKRGKKPGEDDNNANESVNDDDPNTQKKKDKRKKAAKSSLSTNVESQLNVEIEVNECIDPFFAQLAATTGDMTSSNRAFNSTLPVDDKTLGITLRSDVIFLDKIGILNELLDIENLEMFERKSNLLDIFTSSDQICGPFHGFCITDWDPEKEEQQLKSTDQWLDNNLNLSQQAMAFDMNAEVEPLPANMSNGFAYDDDFQNVVESDEEVLGVNNQAIRRDRARTVAHLVDMRPSAQSDGFLEYSYCSAVVGAWAGPSHWKLKNNINKLSRAAERSHTITTVMVKRAPSRKKKQLDYSNEGMSFNRLARECPEYSTVVPAKIMITRKTLAQGAAWSEKNFKRPIDRGFNLTHFKKFNHWQNVLLSLASEKEEQKKNDLPDINDYDYNNVNDTSYCSNAAVDNDNGDMWLGEECDKEGDIHNQIGVIDDNGMEMVEPPPKVAKIFIPYAMRAKKVDMKQLKQVTWKLLTNQYDTETGADKPNVAIDGSVQEINFSSLLQILPTKLSNNMKESLSVSLSLLAVLHIANEKGLQLDTNSDYTDFYIKGDLYE